MQFIYLGEASFYEERMNEFLAVAKSLEIKELCNASPEENNEPDELPPCDPETSTDGPYVCSIEVQCIIIVSKVN